jgi:hypothetical protein
MKSIFKLIKKEPVAFQAVVQTGLALSVAFGTSLSSGQVGAIMAFTAALLAFITRRAVNPTDSDDPPIDHSAQRVSA